MYGESDVKTKRLIQKQDKRRKKYFDRHRSYMYHSSLHEWRHWRFPKPRWSSVAINNSGWWVYMEAADVNEVSISGLIQKLFMWVFTRQPENPFFFSNVQLKLSLSPKVCQNTLWMYARTKLFFMFGFSLLSMNLYDLGFGYFHFPLDGILFTSTEVQHANMNLWNRPLPQSTKSIKNQFGVNYLCKGEGASMHQNKYSHTAI